MASASGGEGAGRQAPRQRLSLIWAMSRNRVIGSNGELPWELPDEAAYFHAATAGRPVIMGRRTFESIARPLPGRLNIVLSRSGFCAPGATSAEDLDAALDAARRDPADECFVVGGEEPYALALPRADRLYETVIDAHLDGDTFFPCFSLADWRQVASARHGADASHAYRYETRVYERTTT